MAEKRKLVAEIEKVFRKIDEGVADFETIMAKLEDANSDNQRERFQEELKKEIKKLQRFRDQIKAWQNSNDVKDKDKLLDYRKIIEQVIFYRWLRIFLIAEIECSRTRVHGCACACACMDACL